MKTLIQIKGKWYYFLLLTDGKIYLSRLFDTGNNVVKSGVIWEMQPFFYPKDIWYGAPLEKIINLIRELLS